MNKTLARLISGVIPIRDLRKKVRLRLIDGKRLEATPINAHLRNKLYATPADEMPHIAWKSEPQKPGKALLKQKEWGEKNTFSQSGEDAALAEFISLLGSKTMYAIEFGAWDGKHLSNVFHFVKNLGWRALMIEGNPARAEVLRQTAREVDGRIEAVCGCVGIKKHPLLDTYLQNCPSEPDILSIDVDGIDYHIWKSLQSVQPRIVIIEFNPAIPSDIIFVQAGNENVFEGSSASALVELGVKKGYSLAAVVGCNLIFVNNSEFAKLGIEDNSLETLWTSAPRTSIFHTYSGKIYTWGMDRLFWNNAEIKPDMLQYYSSFTGNSEDIGLNNSSGA